MKIELTSNVIAQLKVIRNLEVLMAELTERYAGIYAAFPSLVSLSDREHYQTRREEISRSLGIARHVLAEQILLLALGAGVEL